MFGAGDGFKSVTLAGAGKTGGVGGRAGGCLGRVGGWRTHLLLLICCFLALHQVSDSSGVCQFAFFVWLRCSVAAAPAGGGGGGAWGDASGFPPPASGCHRGGGLSPSTQAGAAPRAHEHLPLLPNFAKSDLNSAVVQRRAGGCQISRQMFLPFTLRLDLGVGGLCAPDWGSPRFLGPPNAAGLGHQYLLCNVSLL